MWGEHDGDGVGGGVDEAHAAERSVFMGRVGRDTKGVDPEEGSFGVEDGGGKSGKGVTRHFFFGVKGVRLPSPAPDVGDSGKFWDF